MSKYDRGIKFLYLRSVIGCIYSIVLVAVMLHRNERSCTKNQIIPRNVCTNSLPTKFANTTQLVCKDGALRIDESGPS